MASDVISILVVLLFLGLLIATVGYYALDHSKTFRERQFMRSIRRFLQAADAAVSDGLRAGSRIVLVICIAALGLVVVGALVKWSLEEFAK